ncbi:hypothetical protein C0995_011546 [Termitomyces sp. Mi166|nr:hypothetical protein C0995_011546 [Termitomyces sp. Mi166\
MMLSTDLHRTLVLADALHSDITALKNRKQDLVKIWKMIPKTTMRTMAIAPWLKVEALKWTEKVKDKGEKAAGVLKYAMKRRATELLRVTDQVRGSDLVEGTNLVGKTDLVFRPDHSALQLIRKVIACTPPLEDDDDKENEEEETSQCREAITPQMLLGKYKKTAPQCASKHLNMLCDYCEEKDLQCVQMKGGMACDPCWLMQKQLCSHTANAKAARKAKKEKKKAKAVEAMVKTTRKQKSTRKLTGDEKIFQQLQ